MDTIVKTTSRILFPFVIVFGLFITVNGHLSPGGGFSGGAIIATGFAMLIIAYTERRVEHRFHQISFIDAKSVAAIGMLALVSFGIFLRLELIKLHELWYPLGGGFTLPSNVFGTIMVSTALVIIVYSIIKE